MNLPAETPPSICPRRAGARALPRSRRPARALTLFAVALAGAWLLPSRAGAFERQWHAGASFGYLALFGTTKQTLHGFGGGAHLAYGITDAVNLVGEINLNGHPSGRSLVTGGGVGASYIVDILQWVPHVGALVGASDVVDASGECSKYCHSLRLNLEVPFGLDYTVSRSLAVGVAGRYQIMLSGYKPAQAVGAFARIEILWGY